MQKDQIKTTFPLAKYNTNTTIHWKNCTLESNYHSTLFKIFQNFLRYILQKGNKTHHIQGRNGSIDLLFFNEIVFKKSHIIFPSLDECELRSDTPLLL